MWYDVYLIYAYSECGTKHVCATSKALASLPNWRQRGGVVSHRPSYDFNYCLMSLFLLCLFGTRLYIFSTSPLPGRVFARCSYKYEVRSPVSVTDMFGATPRCFWDVCSRQSRIELSAVTLRTLFRLAVWERLKIPCDRLSELIVFDVYLGSKVVMRFRVSGFRLLWAWLLSICCLPRYWAV